MGEVNSHILLIQCKFLTPLLIENVALSPVALFKAALSNLTHLGGRETPW